MIMATATAAEAARIAAHRIAVGWDAAEVDRTSATRRLVSWSKRRAQRAQNSAPAALSAPQAGHEITCLAPHIASDTLLPTKGGSVPCPPAFIYIWAAECADFTSRQHHSDHSCQEILFGLPQRLR